MKQTSFTLLLAVLTSMVSLQVFADFDTSTKIQVGDLYYYLDNDNLQAQVTSMPEGKYTGDIVIPSDITHEAKKYSVTSIGICAFSGCSGLTSITIPNSVTSIGWLALSDCSSLTSITIPNSVTSIGDGAFVGCSGLTSITIGNSVTSIGGGAFSGCSGLTSITIPNSVTSIGGGAFRDCSGLTSITIPNSVTSIGDKAFDSCSGLASVIIPNSVTSIGDKAFRDCSNLQDFYLYAEQLPTTGSDVFYDVNTANAKLHVPADKLSAYQATAPWKDFGTIVALTDDDPKPAGIADVRSRMSEVRGAYYDLNGRRLNGEPTQRGIYMHHGRKVVVK